MPPSNRGDAPFATLRRALGRWDLTAIGINQVIGSAIFLLPASIAARIGGWSAIGVVFAGLASMLIALCLAESASRFESTGGPYLFTRAAFGRFAGFEVGWMQWFVRALAYAAILNGLALALGFYWPFVTSGVGRVLLVTSVVAALAWINVRGVRQSSLVITLLTIGKLLPLAIFIVTGLFFVNWSRMAPSGAISLSQAGSAALLLIFAFGGYEVIPVPAGEARHPARHLPFALVATILAATAVLALVQLVAQGILPDDLAQSETPLADAALISLGGAGALMIGVGSVVSMMGTNAGQVLTGSRMLFALAENGELPSWFARIHPRFRTPANTVLFTSSVAFALALTGSFEALAAASAVARLVVYGAACASTVQLRRPGYAQAVRPATFVIPFGPSVPVLALAVVVAVLAGATGQQLLGGLSALVVGAALFIITGWLRNRVNRRAMNERSSS